uniref:PSQ10.11c n=1 Tax=Nocardiopsis sp. 90127 TaxID=373213 RepID=Q27I77_9ACTN|nr:hypothetical protein [Nocardiopsis sp. 90127]ABD48734.1 pSQ10.11c [Nocardiopsis sp. 90127]
MAEKKNPFEAATTSRGTRTPAPAPAGKTTEEPKPRPKPKKRGTTARRTDPVRMTIDLDPPSYSQMRRVLLDVADAADRPTLTAAAMWRAALEELAEDPRLVARVAKRITAVQEER